MYRRIHRNKDIDETKPCETPRKNAEFHRVTSRKCKAVHDYVGGAGTADLRFVA